MSRTIAFFDFDGTITTKDTLLEFIKYGKGSFRFYTGFLLNSPWLIAYRLKIISNQAAKERILTWFFGNYPVTDFRELCDRFAAEIIPGLIRPKALQEIALLRQKGAAVVIVSASPANWLQGWADSIQAALLATRLETTTPASAPKAITSGTESPPGAATTASPGTGPTPVAPTPVAPRLTGRILGLNCYGKEKVRRIQEAYTLSDYDEIYTYGDTSGDKPMLGLGTHAFYKPFR